MAKCCNVYYSDDECNNVINTTQVQEFSCSNIQTNCNGVLYERAGRISATDASYN